MNDHPRTSLNGYGSDYTSYKEKMISNGSSGYGHMSTAMEMRSKQRRRGGGWTTRLNNQHGKVMADISKCLGHDCPLKETCYRHTAPSNTHWQAYGDFTFKEGTCPDYWHRCKHIRRDGESCNLNNKCTYPNCNEDGQLKPIHKFNNGDGATLCHGCSVIINIGLTDDLFCKECLEKRNEFFKKFKDK